MREVIACVGYQYVKFTTAKTFQILSFLLISDSYLVKNHCRAPGNAHPRQSSPRRLSLRAVGPSIVRPPPQKKINLTPLMLLMVVVHFHRHSVSYIKRDMIAFVLVTDTCIFVHWRWTFSIFNLSSSTKSSIPQFLRSVSEVHAVTGLAPSVQSNDAIKHTQPFQRRRLPRLLGLAVVPEGLQGSQQRFLKRHLYSPRPNSLKAQKANEV